MITLLIKSPKPFQSDLNADEVLKVTVAKESTNLYLKSMIEGGLAEEILLNLVENEVSPTADGIEALRLIWMNLKQLKPA